MLEQFSRYLQLHAEKLTQLLLCKVLRVSKLEQTRPETTATDEMKEHANIFVNFKTYIFLFKSSFFVTFASCLFTN